MRQTNYSRKLDTLGRLVLPAPLREQLGIEVGQDYDFFIHEHENEIYLCIKCANADPEVEAAKKILEKAGYAIDKK